ncbi:hypothetical protein C4580_04335 [Candidatus Woesearchaeota archaeon]|nr:MAG: hypothetical protein C4580_04335 [Candidatus Woesearchaeota archaeon]
MGESYEARQKRLKLQREKVAARKKKKAAAEHKRAVNLLFAPKESERQVNYLAQNAPIQYGIPFPPMMQQQFAQLMMQYLQAMYAQAGPVVPYVAERPTPRQIPLNWAELFRGVLDDGKIRASSAVGFYGICERKTLLEKVEEKEKFFHFGERPKAMREGSLRHKELENSEKSLVELLRREGYAVRYDKEALCTFPGLSFVQETSFDGVFDVPSGRVTVMGHPDRVVAGCGSVYVLEAKTNVHRFSERLVMGATVQGLLYGLMLARYTGRPVKVALTDSTQPLERRELELLARGDDLGFEKSLLSGKARVLFPFDSAAQQMALSFLDHMVSVYRNPLSARGSDLCDRYECPFRNRGCEFYQAKEM